jgi:2-amino-4-hydroxy-6-hydroxymethyldihydropteridine diphosphokinase
VSLILATGSNLLDKKTNLDNALRILKTKFSFIAASRVYTSEAVEYLNQPEFYNQVLEFEIPKISAQDTLQIINKIELELGRKRDIPKGPRIIDIDIIFWNLDEINSSNLTIPHPAWKQRSFVSLPLQELPYCKNIVKKYIIPNSFSNSAFPLK